MTGRASGLQEVGTAMLVVTIWLELCTSFIAQVVTATSIILSSNKIQNSEFGVGLAEWIVLENGCYTSVVVVVIVVVI